ncbi:hypothetical protein [Thermanaeromonas sp. C210]|nr:hypothetical protein [Thermanaeromonas sp. C210]
MRYHSGPLFDCHKHPGLAAAGSGDLRVVFLGDPISAGELKG